MDRATRERRTPRRMFSIIATMGLLAGMLAIVASPAQAAVPDHGTSFFTQHFVDDGTCTFSLDVTETATDDFVDFFNSDGSFRQAIVHLDIRYIISGNGHTIYERDRFQEFFYPDGSREVGLTVHILGPGGIVQLDAGQIVFNEDGSVAYIRGPHPQFEGQTSFCSALEP